MSHATLTVTKACVGWETTAYHLVRYTERCRLDDLTLSVPAGQVVGFLGPNGAGKTTTMRAIFRPCATRPLGCSAL